MRYLALFCIVLLQIALAVPAFASPVNVSDEICVLRDGKTQSAQDAFNRLDAFDCRDDALLAEGNDIWIYLDVETAIKGFSDPAILLHMSYHGAITVAPIYDGVAISKRYDTKDLVQKARVPDLMSFPLGRGLDAPEGVLIRVEQVWDLTNWSDIYIASQESINNRHIQSSLFYAILTGLLITPLIFTAIIYIILRIDFLPYHFGMVSFALIYALSWSGMIFALPFEITPIGRSYITHISIAAAFMCACFLTRTLIGEAVIGRLWYRVLPMAGIIPIFVVFIIVSAAPDYSHVGSVVLHAVYLFPLVSIIGALTVGVWNRHLISRLQLLAWLPMIVYVAVSILKGIGLIEHNAIIEYGLYPSIISEALLTTCVIAYRVYTVRKSHERALREQVILRNLATTDALTGALNRRAFIENFEQTVAASPGSGVLSLLLLDIDHFKTVNDTHGHTVGDEILKEVVTVLQSQCRNDDMLARFGGEEFSLFMSTPTKAIADACAERIRAAVDKHAFAQGCDITVSIGVITVDVASGVSFDQWYSAADRALYAAKTKGRNRVQRSNWTPASIIPLEEASYAAGWVPKEA